MMEILAYTPTTLAEAMHASRPTVYRWMRIPGFPVVRLSCLYPLYTDVMENQSMLTVLKKEKIENGETVVLYRHPNFREE